jgi:hypothetical protein
MITLAEVEKLSRVHAVEPAVLSVYLTVPPSAAELAVRVDELAAAAERAAGRSGRLREEDRWSARVEAALAGRGRPGHRLAVFACAEIGLLEVVMLPEAGPVAWWADRGVLGVRPHIRPLLAALQSDPRRTTEVLAEPGGDLTAAGLPGCLAAVNAGAAETLVVPSDGLIPGYECGRCGALGLTPDCCPDWGTAALPVPDVIEEMISRTLEDGGRVVVVHDALEGFAARMPSARPAGM